MPSFNNIDNGESGLSVRNTLNDVINYVNTGITSGGSFTYITEDTTPGSEYVNIKSPRDVYISGGTSVELEYYGSPTITGYVLLNNSETTLHMDDNGVDISTLTLTPTNIDIITTGNIYMSGTSVELEYYGAPTTERYIILDGMQGGFYNGDGTNDTNLVFGTTQVDLTTTLYNGNISQLFADGNYLQLFVSNTGGTSNEVLLDPQQDSRISATDGTDNSIVGMSPSSLQIRCDDTTTDFSGTIDMNKGQVLITTQDKAGVNFTTEINSVPTNLQLKSENGITTEIVTLDINSQQYVLNVNNGSGLTSTETITPTDITSTVTDGSYTSGIEIINEYSRLHAGQGVYFSEFKVNVDAIQTTSTDGTWTNTTTIDPDRSLFEITDGTTSANIDLDAINGINIIHNDGLGREPKFGLDANTSKGTINSSYLGITDELTISPDSNIDNTKIKSSFSGGAFSQLVMTYDNPSWECTDGSDSSSITLASTTVSFNVNDGVNQTTFEQTSTSYNFSNVPAFDDDTDASSLSTGDLYQTTGGGASPLDVAGILMIKQ